MLGYLGGQLTTKSQFGQVSEYFGMDDVRCTGKEASIFDCSYTTSDNCGADEGMGVICSGSSGRSILRLQNLFE